MSQANTVSFSDTLNAQEPRTTLRELSPAGEELSAGEIELVSGGTCHWTKPAADSDYTCIGGMYD